MTKTALIFPGQGAQFVGMGKEFYDSSKEAKAIFEKADSIISGLSNVIFNGPQEKLTSTAFCQPAIFTVSIAALKAFEAHPKFKSISPRYTCGLSLGEYSSLAAAKSLSFEDTLKLVERRSYFMEEATRIKKGAMAAVIGFSAIGGSASGGDKDELLKICRATGAEVANFNSPEQIVITGEEAKVKEASVMLTAQGAKRVIPLDVSGAFHSSLMLPAVPKFEVELNKVKFHSPQFPIMSNVDGKPCSDPNIIRQNLAKQITSSVQWVDSINYIAAQGVEHFFEIGPGTVLKGLIRRINPALKVHNIQKPADVESISF